MKDKRILIIYTGGTIGMTSTPEGYAPEKGYLKSALENISDMNSVEMPRWELLEFDELLDSSNITYVEWNLIARAIENNYEDYDGFVVLHGTDTMAYTASALSFMLENLAKPVILTGSQIPLCELRSDGKDNIITSVIIAAEGVVKEVALYFGTQLLRGNRSTKQSADGLIAFASPNYPPLARAGINIEYNNHLLMDEPEGDFKVCYIERSSIGVIKLFPGIQFELFEPIVTDRLQGLVLETFGTGNIPSYDAVLPELIARAIRNGTAVVVCTQCAHGTVQLGAYETSSALAKAGAVSGFNMTTEATIAKLHYLFSKHCPNDKMHVIMNMSLRGEVNPA